MKISDLIILFALVITAAGCGSNEETVIPSPDVNAPIVQSLATYEVHLQSDIVYAQAQSHESLNSETFQTIDLKLDVYTPDNTMSNRPAYLFIHGGGFIGGSKDQEQIVNIANYYASRGWVFISADYRLRDDFGTTPEAWVEYSSNLPNESVAQFLAIYPAQRDAKAAMRWVIANASDYNINTDYLTVGGGSAGAITALTVGISSPDEYTNELSSTVDPTLASTNLSEVYQVRTIIDYWGSKVALDALEEIYGSSPYSANMSPLLIVHGTEDPTVPFSSAEDLKEIYETNGVTLAYYPIEGAGHGVWNASVNNKRIEELAFDFIVEQQGILVE